MGSCRREILDHVIALNEQHLRRLIGIRNRHDARDGLAFGLEPQALGIHAVERRPAHRLDREGPRLANLRWTGCAADKLQRRYREARVHRTEDRAQALTIRLDRSLVGRRGREVALPVFLPATILAERSPGRVSGWVPGRVSWATLARQAQSTINKDGSAFI